MIAESYRRARKWTLAPLGAILFVVIVFVTILFLLFPGGSEQLGWGAIRAYYRSATGGAIPSAALARLTFDGCRNTGWSISEADQGVECDLTVGKQVRTVCFVFTLDYSGVIEDGHKLGCGWLEYRPSSDSFVFGFG